VHRAGNTIEEIYGVFAELVQDTKLVFPVHPRTEKYLRECGPYRKLADTPNIILIKPAAGYLEMLVLTKNAAKILTDS
jgi:UDP-GlcNAc3NAcA epimerase